MADKRDVETAGGDSAEQLRRIYGEHAMISRVDRFVLVHLDNPSEDEIHRRIEEFNPDDFFFDDCYLCQLAKQEGGHVIFDAQADALSYVDTTVRTPLAEDDTVTYERNGISYTETMKAEDLEAASEIYDSLATDVQTDLSVAQIEPAPTGSPTLPKGRPARLPCIRCGSIEIIGRNTCAACGASGRYRTHVLPSLG
jgi:hypothetical protein